MCDNKRIVFVIEQPDGLEIMVEYEPGSKHPVELMFTKPDNNGIEIVSPVYKLDEKTGLTLIKYIVDYINQSIAMRN